MATYYISTDSGSWVEPIEYPSLAEALESFGVPAKVVDEKTFVRWLEAVGGYGFIERDGEVIAEVPS